MQRISIKLVYTTVMFMSLNKEIKNDSISFSEEHVLQHILVANGRRAHHLDSKKSMSIHAIIVHSSISGHHTNWL